MGATAITATEPDAREVAKANLQRAQAAQAYATSVFVFDQDSFDAAQEAIKLLAAEEDSQAEQRDSYIAPLKTVIARVKHDFDPALDALKAARAMLKSKCVDYRAECARQRVLAEQHAQRLLDEGRDATDAIVAVQATTANATAGVHFRDKWVVEVVDAATLPEKYFKRVIDFEALDADVRAGARQIPGTKIENRPVMVTRRG